MRICVDLYRLSESSHRNNHFVSVTHTMELNPFWSFKPHFYRGTKITISWLNFIEEQLMFRICEIDRLYSSFKSGKTSVIIPMIKNRTNKLTNIKLEFVMWEIGCFHWTKDERSGGTMDWPKKIQTTNLLGPFWLSPDS